MEFVDEKNLETVLEGVKLYVNKKAEESSNDSLIVTITSLDDGAYRSSATSEQIYNAYSQNLLICAIYEDNIIPLVNAQNNVCYFSGAFQPRKPGNHVDTVRIEILGSTVTVATQKYIPSTTWSDLSRILSHGTPPSVMTVSGDTVLGTPSECGLLFYKDGIDSTSIGYVLLTDGGDMYNIWYNRRDSSFDYEKLTSSLSIGAADTDGYVPTWNNTTHQYELQKIASGASAFEVTFTQGPTAKELTSDKTMAEIWAAYGEGNIIRGTMTKDGVEYTFTLVGASQTRMVFQQIMSNGVTCVIGDKDKWSWDGFKAQAVENLTTSMSSSSTDIQYPSAKAVYDSLPTLKTWTSADVGAST